MFTTFIVQPIFNLLVLIYALLPGHNFGLAIIIFTILVRLLMGPLVKKQLHHAKAMRELQPELKRIKKEAKGDRQKESTMVMELYKERQINPFASIGIIIVQLPILIGLYSGISKIVDHPQTLIDFSYPFIRDLSWMKELATNLSKFDNSLFGIVDLGRAALGQSGVYWPAMIIVVASAVAQFFQTKQLLPNDKDARGLRRIIKDARKGEQADSAELNAAIGQATPYIIPFTILFITVRIASALSLYWLVAGLVAFVQQWRILKKDEQELEAIADRPEKKSKKVIEGEVVAATPKSKPKKPNSGKKAKRRKR